MMQATVMVIIRPEVAEVCVWNNELFHPDLPLEAQATEALISHFPLSATGSIVLAHMLLTAAIRLAGSVGYQVDIPDEVAPAEKQRVEEILGDLEIDLP